MDGIRQHFPALNHITYLDTAASGVVPEPVMAWRRNHEIALQQKPLAFRSSIPEVLQSTRQAIAAYMNAKEKEVALIPNFSFGINSILEALPKNQKIAILNNEYPSVTWPVLSRNFKTYSIDTYPPHQPHIAALQVSF